MTGYKKFKGFMAEHDLTQNDIAELLGVTRQYINMALNGKRGADLKGSHITLICNHYGISSDDYFHKVKSSSGNY